FDTFNPKSAPSVQSAGTKAKAAMPSNVQVILIAGMRTFAESDALYAQGRTEPGPIVTNAPAGESFHNYGLAVDFDMVTNGKDDYEVSAHWLGVGAVTK